MKCEKVNRTFGPAGQKFCKSGQVLTCPHLKKYLNLKNYIPLKIVRKIFTTKHKEKTSKRNTLKTYCLWVHGSQRTFGMENWWLKSLSPVHFKMTDCYYACFVF